MAVKANNIMSFRSDQVNTTVHLVRRSVGKYRTPGKKPGGADLIWWRGQLAYQWRVWFETAPGVFEWCYYRKGQVVWFDAELFHPIISNSMVNCKKITHERLGSWEKKIVGSHATPVLLMGVGHDHVNGQIIICCTEDRTDQELILFLQGAIKELQKNNT